MKISAFAGIFLLPALLFNLHFLSAQNGIPGISPFVRIEPDSLSMAQLKQFTITLGARNRGEQIRDPHFSATRLLIDSVPSPVWDVLVDQGRRPPEWTDLPPGKSVALAWSAIGSKLFSKPGSYHLQFFYFERELLSLTIRITE